MYIKLSDIEYAKPEHKTICEALYKDILAEESQLVSDEEMLEYFKSVMGDRVGGFIGSPTVTLNRKILLALKMTFWYYSGKSPANVVGEEPEVDIFNP